MGYVIVHTESKDFCFTGTGTIEYRIDDVISIDTANNIASWRYEESNGEESREPNNTDWHIHVCSGLVVPYSTPVQLKKIFIANPSDKVKCTDKIK